MLGPINNLSMKKNELENRLVSFADSVITLTSNLPQNFANNHLGKQLIRSSTAAALNYGEAQSGESLTDFIHKMKLVLKELRESFINIKILGKQNAPLRSPIAQVYKENNELIAIFVSSVKTAQSNLK